MLGQPGFAASARALSVPGEKDTAGAAEGNDADFGDDDRASMGTMTGWQALADEVKAMLGTCSVHHNMLLPTRAGTSRFGYR